MNVQHRHPDKILQKDDGHEFTVVSSDFYVFDKVVKMLTALRTQQWYT